MTERRDPPWDEQLDQLDADEMLTEWFNEEAPRREPAVLAPNVIARTALTRRRSRWFVRDWWRDLFRDAHRPSMTAALGGLTGALAVLVLLVVVAMPTEQAEDPTVPIPADAILVGEADGFALIGDAIAAAVENETVAIFPGTYTENLVIDKAIRLVGAGDPDAIVLRPADPEQPVLTIDSVEASVEGFTIEGPGTGVSILSGAPLIKDMVFRGLGDQWWTWTGTSWDGYDQARPSILVELFAEPTIEGNTFDGGGEVEVRGSSVVRFVGNTLINGAALFLNDAGGGTLVQGNTITDSGRFSIESTSGAELLIEDNTIAQSDPGIGIQLMRTGGEVRNNTITGAQTGIMIGDGASARISGNTIDTSGAAFEIHEGVSPEITDNVLCADNAIVALLRGATLPDLEANTLCEGTPVTIE